MLKWLIIPVCLSLCACASVPPRSSEPDRAVIKIEYEPAWLSHTGYAIELNSEGRGRLRWTNGTPNDRYLHVRKFRVSTQVFRNLESQLRMLRPVGTRLIDGDNPECGSYVNDQGAIHIIWTDNGPAGHLRYDYGCDSKLNEQLIKTVEMGVISAVPPELQKLSIWKLVHIY